MLAMLVGGVVFSAEPSDAFTSAPMGPAAVHPLVSGSHAVVESDTLVYKFYLWLESNDAETLVSLIGDDKPVGAWNDLGYTLRAKDGIFDAYHGNGNGGPAAERPSGFVSTPGLAAGFGAIEPLGFSKGVNYHVKMEIDLRAQQYSVWVLPEFGETVKIAEGFAPRNAFDNVNRICMANAGGGGVNRLSNGRMFRGSQLVQAVAAVNEVGSRKSEVEAFKAALTATTLGLPLDDYTTLTTEGQTVVANTMIGHIMQKGPYADDMAVLRDFERIVARVVNDGALVPSKPRDLRFIITTPGGTSPENSFRARGYLDWEPSSGNVRYYSILRAEFDKDKKAFGEDVEIARVIPDTPKMWYTKFPQNQPDTRFIDGTVESDTRYRYKVVTYNAALAPSEAAETEVTFPPRQDVPLGHFTNPLYTAGEGTFRAGGHYYAVGAVGLNAIRMMKAKSITGLQGPGEIIFKAVPGTDYAAGFMAAKAAYLKFDGDETGRWYVYFTAGENNSSGQTLLDNDACHVIEGGTDPNDPLCTPYVYKGRIETGLTTNNIDPITITINGKHYFLNSCGGIRIFEMENAWTLKTRMNGSDDKSNNLTHNQRWNGGLDWYSYHGNLKLTFPGVTEAAAPLYGPGGEVYIVYSANQTFSTQYCLGLLEYKGGDPLLPASWKVHPEPIFVTSEENGVWGPGHSINVPSPADPFEVWNLCGAMLSTVEDTPFCWVRPIVANKITWERRADGKHFPNFGIPAAPGAFLPLPKGEEKLTWRTVRVTHSEGGEIWPVGEVRIADSDTRMFLIKPAAGRRISSVAYDDMPVPPGELSNRVGGATSYHLLDVTRDGKLHVEFQ